MMRMSVPRSRRWVAKLWRSECTVTGLRMPAASAVSWNRRLSWRVVIGLRGLPPGNSQRCSGRTPLSWRVLPPLAQQTEHLGRQHDVAVLAPFGLHDTDDVLGAVDVADPEPDHLAGARATAIAEREQRADLRGASHGEETLRLLGTHDQRKPLWLFEVVDLGGQVQAPERHAEQELNAGHDAVAIADARPALHQVQLEAADVIGGGGVRRAVPEKGEPLAAVDVASLRVGPELPGVHVLDHALAQRADRTSGHGKRLPG